MKSLKINLLTLLIVLATLPFAASAQSQVPAGDYPNVTDAAGKKQGAWKKLDENGTCIYVGQFKDDVAIGVFKYFDTDGRIMSEMNFLNGGPAAYCKMYNVAGKIEAEGKYMNHQKDSLWKFYTEDGILLSVESYKLGIKDGKSTVYFPGTNQAASITTYKNGLEEGAYVEFYLDGAKKEEATYVHGKLEGKAVWYFADGNINILGNYLHSVKDGKWTYYEGPGKVKGTEVWEKGKLKSGEVIIDKDKLNQQTNDPQQGNYNGQEPSGGQ